MSVFYCAKCSAQLPTSAVNVEQGVAFCETCDELFALQDLQELSQPQDSLLENFPAGCTLRKKDTKKGEVLMVRASTRSWGQGISAFIFAIPWNGFVSFFAFAVYGAVFEEFLNLFSQSDQLINQQGIDEQGEESLSWPFGLALCVFVIPFVIAGWYIAVQALMYLLGRIEVELQGQQGKVRTGIGFLSWTRRVDLATVEALSSGKPWLRDEDGKDKVIVLQSTKALKFGSFLNDRRLEWMQLVLQILLFEPKDSVLRSKLLEKARKP